MQACRLLQIVVSLGLWSVQVSLWIFCFGDLRVIQASCVMLALTFSSAFKSQKGDLGLPPMVAELEHPVLVQSKGDTVTAVGQVHQLDRASDALTDGRRPGESLEQSLRGVH